MPKNLVMLHLESISNTILWQYRVELGTVWRLMQQSESYSCFHSNATSTVMAYEYFMFGSTFISDYRTLYLANVTHPEILRGTSLMDSLKNALGYSYRNYTLDLFRRDNIENEMHSVHDTSNAIFDSMRGQISEAVAAGKPFALYFNDSTSHMALDNLEKARAPTFSERFRQAYRCMDANMNRLLSLLIETGQWDNTVIVAFGDHGDELWSHALNRGFCHGTPPYASLTWTPMFIYENGREPTVKNQLAGIADMKKTLLHRLAPDFSPEGELPDGGSVPFSGIELSENTRRHVFSQNLYALQLEYSDPERALSKGYSVTDGTYRMVVTSGGENARDGGIEFYCDRLDPTNSRNLADFLILNSRGEPMGFRRPPDAAAPEFEQVFTPGAVAGLMEKYNELRRALEEYVRAKEKTALPHSAGARHHVMPERAFLKIRKRMHRG